MLIVFFVTFFFGMLYVHISRFQVINCLQNNPLSTVSLSAISKQASHFNSGTIFQREHPTGEHLADIYVIIGKFFVMASLQRQISAREISKIAARNPIISTNFRLMDMYFHILCHACYR